MDEQRQAPGMNEALRVAAARGAIAVGFAALVGVMAFGATRAHQASPADVDHSQVLDTPSRPLLAPPGTSLTHVPDHIQTLPLPEGLRLEIVGDSPTGS